MEGSSLNTCAISLVEDRVKDRNCPPAHGSGRWGARRRSLGWLRYSATGITRRRRVAEPVLETRSMS
jgi:hypothetical protein